MNEFELSCWDKPYISSGWWRNYTKVYPFTGDLRAFNKTLAEWGGKFIACSDACIIFEHERDAMVFLLRWS